MKASKKKLRKIKVRLYGRDFVGDREIHFMFDRELMYAYRADKAFGYYALCTGKWKMTKEALTELGIKFKKK